MGRSKYIGIHKQPPNWQDRAKLNEEYWQAYFNRLDGPPRIIANPSGAAAVKEVLDQIPRVRADLDRNGC